jgi:hypothetical protein
LPPESLLLIAENSMAMAERYQPELTDPTTREKNPNPLHNEERYAFWLAASREAYKAAAPYYAPRLHAIAVAPVAAAGTEVERPDPRKLMFDKYMEMRRRGELAVDITKRKPQPPVIEDQPAPKPPEDDDADGVAV